MTISIEMPIAVGVLDRARSGDVAAFAQLIRLHERRVLGVAFRLTGNLADAQDAAQEVFMRLHRNLASIPGSDSVAPWLYRVTVNACFDMRRRSKSSAAIAIPASLAAREPSAEALAVRQQDHVRLNAALGELGERERAALILRDLEGLTTAEVAVALGSSESTVRVQIARARLKLRELLKDLR